jgi:MHS family alpha-ketoglutarate permease-like MFS transporter
LLASLVVVILQASLGEAALTAWGWRIPFVIGAIAALLALLARLRLTETTSHASRGSAEAGRLGALLRRYPRAFLTVLGFTAGGSLVFYTFTTYMQKFLINSAGMDKPTASRVMTVCLALSCLPSPRWARFPTGSGGAHPCWCSAPG